MNLFSTVVLLILSLYLVFLFRVYFGTEKKNHSSTFLVGLCLSGILPIVLLLFPLLVAPFGYPIDSGSIPASTPQEYFKNKKELERPVVRVITMTLFLTIVTLIVSAVTQKNTYIIARICFVLVGLGLSILLWMYAMIGTLISWPD